MNRLDELKERLSTLTRLTRLQAAEAAELTRKHPGLPEEYVRFLSEIGFGDLGEMQLYSGPVAYGTIYPGRRNDRPHVLIFGDDFQGYCFGFDREAENRIVEIDPRGTAHPLEDSGFLALIDNKVEKL